MEAPTLPHPPIAYVPAITDDHKPPLSYAGHVITTLAFAGYRSLRELRNYLERCIALQSRVAITDQSRPAVDVRIGLKEARAGWNFAFERMYLDDLPERTEQCVGGHARRSGGSALLLSPALASQVALARLARSSCGAQAADIRHRRG